MVLDYNTQNIYKVLEGRRGSDHIDICISTYAINAYNH
jgi:hypothetical protein